MEANVVNVDRVEFVGLTALFQVDNVDGMFLTGDSGRDPRSIVLIIGNHLGAIGVHNGTNFLVIDIDLGLAAGGSRDETDFKLIEISFGAD